MIDKIPLAGRGVWCQPPKMAMGTYASLPYGVMVDCAAKTRVKGSL